MLGLAHVNSLRQGHAEGPHLRPARVVLEHGRPLGVGSNRRLGRRHSVPHGRPLRAMPHIQLVRQRLLARRGRERHHDEVGCLEGPERFDHAGHAGRAGRSQCQLDCAQRARTVRDDCEGRQGSTDDRARVDCMGVPRHWHLAGRPHRGGGREEDPDQDSQVGALDAHVKQDQHRPLGGRGGHGRHLQVRPAVQVRQVLSYRPLAYAESALGARGVRRRL
mmetsp:Transcript_102125/g.271782  ORF Transcript_102125/g.271782 Transcript_102125/m.271782 type:complete len:220 (-) Transcript_102125:775-1434(-)